MKELLFGWLIKPRCMLTSIDALVALIEIGIVLVVRFVVIIFIMYSEDDRK